MPRDRAQGRDQRGQETPRCHAARKVLVDGQSVCYWYVLFLNRCALLNLLQPPAVALHPADHNAIPKTKHASPLHPRLAVPAPEARESQPLPPPRRQPSMRGIPSLGCSWPRAKTLPVTSSSPRDPQALAHSFDLATMSVPPSSPSTAPSSALGLAPAVETPPPARDALPARRKISSSAPLG